MDRMFAAPRYLALLNGDPTTAGLLTQEMTGGGYLRKLCPFGTANGMVVTTTETMWWADLPNTPIRYIAVVSQLTGGDMIAYMATGSDIYVPEGEKFIIAGGDLAFQITIP